MPARANWKGPLKVAAISCPVAFSTPRPRRAISGELP